MKAVPVTDIDREAANRVNALGPGWTALAIAQAREEGRREEREAIVALERNYSTLWEFRAAVRARGEA